MQQLLLLLFVAENVHWLYSSLKMLFRRLSFFFAYKLSPMLLFLLLLSLYRSFPLHFFNYASKDTPPDPVKKENMTFLI